MRLPLVLFLIAPLIEIASFIIVGQAIGVLPTLALIVLSAVAGVALLRFQGAGILRRLQSGAAITPRTVDSTWLIAEASCSFDGKP